MTRAVYHQFTDKADPFAAVLDEVEAEIAHRVADAVAAFDPADTRDSSWLVPAPGSAPAPNRICSASFCWAARRSWGGRVAGDLPP
jgi:hypothetical protein